MQPIPFWLVCICAVKKAIALYVSRHMHMIAGAQSNAQCQISDGMQPCNQQAEYMQRGDALTYTISLFAYKMTIVNSQVHNYNLPQNLITMAHSQNGR